MERWKVGRATSGGFSRVARTVAAAVLMVIAIGVQGARGEEPARIDLNAASAAELETLPGVGPSKAQAIIAHREVAPFKSADELIEVKGIGAKLYAQLKDRVTVSAAPGAAPRPRRAGDPAAAAPADGRAGRASTASAR